MTREALHPAYRAAIVATKYSASRLVARRTNKARVTSERDDDDNDDDAAGAADRPAGAGGKNADMERTSMGLTGLSSIGAGGTPQQRREWVLHKLCGLVDAVKQLEVAAFGERSSDATQGGCWALWALARLGWRGWLTLARRGWGGGDG